MSNTINAKNAKKWKILIVDEIPYEWTRGKYLIERFKGYEERSRVVRGKNQAKHRVMTVYELSSLDGRKMTSIKDGRILSELRAYADTLIEKENNEIKETIKTNKQDS